MKKVAIIGMSGIFPEADSIEDFRENLKAGKDSIRRLPDSRGKLYGKINSQEFGYIENIENFDARFFGLTNAEALYMDPFQRILLKLTVDAIYNAGYGLKDFNKTNTSIILSANSGPKKEYSELLEEFHPSVLTGNASAMAAGQIAYFLGTQGSTMMLDSSCSSSLLAIHEAANKIRSGEADFCIAGGVKVLSNLKQEEFLDFGISSNDRRCKPFDDAADGIIGGEGGGLVILKDYQTAVNDGDIIYGVIRSSVANQDGRRSNGLTAPSSSAQTDLFLKAWRAAGVKPEEIDYIEAHGTGTHIGDPIELEGLINGMKTSTNNYKCRIGSVKSNFGHLGEASGVASMIKVLLSLTYKELYPTIHYKQPNRLIDLTLTGLKIQDQYEEWETDKIKITGISSFSLTGNNVHIVLEEFRSENIPVVRDRDQHLLSISAKSALSLNKTILNLADLVSNNDNSISELCYSMNQFRDDFQFRTAVIAKDSKEMTEKLLLKAKEKVEESPKYKAIISLLYPIEISCEQDMNEIVGILDKLDSKNNWLTKELQIENDGHRQLIIQSYLLHQVFKSGVVDYKLIGYNYGKIIIDLVLNKIDLSQAISSVEKIELLELPETKLKKINENYSYEKYLWIELGNSKKVENLFNHCRKIMRVPFSDNLDEFLAEIYKEGININWEIYYKNQEFKRISLPYYSYDEQYYWPKVQVNLKNDDLEIREVVDEKATIGNVEEYVVEIFQKALGIAEVENDDDFFDLGGNSLIGTQIISQLEEAYDLELEYDFLMDYPSIDEVIEYVLNVLDNKNMLDSSTLKVTNTIEKTSEEVLSFSEESMWYLSLLEEDSAYYNIPVSIELTGKVSPLSLEKAINNLLARHKILRSNYINSDGFPKIIYNTELFKLSVIDCSDYSNEFNALNTQVSAQSFNLEKDKLIRFSLFKLAEEKYVLTIIMHHIISDNWSFQLIQKELLQEYMNIENGDTSLEIDNNRLTYRDYAQLIRSKNFNNEIIFWKEYLKELPTEPSYSGVLTRPKEQSFKGRTVEKELSKELLETLLADCNEMNLSIYQMLLAAWIYTVAYHFKQKDVILGIPYANRMEGYNEVIGDFVNVFPYRTIISKEQNFSSILNDVKENFYKVLKRAQLPFNTLVNELGVKRSLAYTPIYQLMFDYHDNHILNRIEMDGFKAKTLKKEIYTVSCDMELVIMRSEEKDTLLLVYNSDIFSEKDGLEITGKYLNLLSEISSKGIESELGQGIFFNDTEEISKGFNF
ncbi:hypothetical protein CMALT430_70070 [Carnobacterium maltaromaticum]|uniref:condensation domain-containing protein n=1 Tax=Carnobacterium maltaromaticum TaxID=2751 RepID=UPI00191B9B5B|nr:condensation domain-containing protein [Carnobacterium maltaromaticum]CAD5901775.1 hypothetical protein CMALT430_70070 [Carnobacterium maltaromaticum]